MIRFALDSSWSDNLNWTNSRTKQERQTTPHKDDEQNNDALQQRNHERKTKKMWKLLISIKGKDKNELEGWFLVKNWPLMTVRHSTFLESFYDIFEFTSKLKQQEKLKKLKKGNCVTITEKRVTIWSFQETDIRHWWKRVTMAKTWHDYGNPNLGGLLHKQKRVTIYLNRATILGAVVAYLSWRLLWKQGLRIGESKVRFWDLKTARRAISSTFYHFMYVLIPL